MAKPAEKAAAADPQTGRDDEPNEPPEELAVVELAKPRDDE